MSHLAAVMLCLRSAQVPIGLHNAIVSVNFGAQRQFQKYHQKLANMLANFAAVIYSFTAVPNLISFTVKLDSKNGEIFSLDGFTSRPPVRCCSDMMPVACWRVLEGTEEKHRCLDT